jgi:predicted ester cyclase
MPYDADFPLRRRLLWDAKPEEYRAVRALWKRHSLAEEARDLPGLIDTLTEDCVYEVVPEGRRWEGHAGARAFYTELLTAFPDVTFQLTDIVIGPQGVIQIAAMRGTHRGTWLDLAPTGGPVALDVIIFFPWDPRAGKFAGEKVYYDRSAWRR